MKNPSKIKFGIIGCGARGSSLAHLITENDASELLIAADIKKEAAIAVGEKFGVKQVTTDIEEVINHPFLDAVVVATPSHLHADVVKDGKVEDWKDGRTNIPSNASTQVRVRFIKWDCIPIKKRGDRDETDSAQREFNVVAHIPDGIRGSEYRPHQSEHVHAALL